MLASPGFAIDRVRLRHYRSIASCDVRLGQFTVLVGQNGSGKSNFVDSLRFVSQSLNENLDNALRERGGASEVRRRSKGHPTHFGITFDVTSNGMAATYGFQIGAVQGGDYRVTREKISIDLTDFGSAPVRIEVREGEVVESSIGTLPRVFPDRLYLVALSGTPEFRPLFDGLAACNVYNINPDAIRHPQKPDPGDLLTRDGSNIASVLEQLQRSAPERKARVEDYLRQIVPSFDSVGRRAMGAWETLEFQQRVAGDQNPWTFQASSMSDGTLRALGVLVALFASPNGAASTVAVEEPESALHPAAAGLLLDALRDASTSRQVLATTHSPDLLDGITDPRELLAVRADEGTTRVAPVDSAARMALTEELYSAGDLLRADQLLPSEDSVEQPELF